MVVTIFECPFRGQKISIAISYDNWVIHEMINVNDIYLYTVDIPFGTYEYKFIVDGIWKYVPDKPFVFNDFGEKNNIIRIKENANLVTIVHISDTHSLFHDNLPEGDILIHSGDFSIDGHPGEYRQFNEWLGRQKFPYKIVILGNHDLDYMMREEKIDPIIEGPKRLSNAIVLSSQSINVCGLKIHGIQWFWFNTWNFDYYDQKYKGKEKIDIPENTDILVTHGPPFGILDDYFGSKLLLTEITIKKPRYHLFGHMHSINGCVETIWENRKSTCFLNSASVCEDCTKIINKPSIINVII